MYCSAKSINNSSLSEILRLKLLWRTNNKYSRLVHLRALREEGLGLGLRVWYQQYRFCPQVDHKIWTVLLPTQLESFNVGAQKQCNVSRVKSSGTVKWKVRFNLWVCLFKAAGQNQTHSKRGECNAERSLAGVKVKVLCSKLWCTRSNQSQQPGVMAAVVAVFGIDGCCFQ